MKIEHFIHNGGDYKQTPDVSSLLSEDKIVELYQTKSPGEFAHLHQTYFGPAVISVTYIEKGTDNKGRETTVNHTFLISLATITAELITALRPFFHSELEPLKLELSITQPKHSRPKG